MGVRVRTVGALAPPTTRMTMNVDVLLCVLLHQGLLSTASGNLLSDSGAALTWRDLNILQVTDTHSWISGHAHGDHDASTGFHSARVQTAPQDADYGDLLAMVQLLSATAKTAGRDLWLFNSGDVVDGTGISNLSPINGELLTPLLTALPFHAVTVGNHELYNSKTIGHMETSGFFKHWNGSYLTSNVVHAPTEPKAGQPLGGRFKVLRGRNSSLLVYGFLYDMQDPCPTVRVQAVKTVVATKWFVASLRARVDAVVVLAHMGEDAPEAQALLAGIRAVKGAAFPIVLLAGHTHYRHYARAGNAATLESGCYFNTVGWLSFDVPPPRTGGKAAGAGAAHAEINFTHRFIDANKATFAAACNVTARALRDVPAAVALRGRVNAVRKDMQLDAVLGCNPAAAVMAPWSHYNSASSLWKFYSEQVIPFSLFSQGSNNGQEEELQWELESTGGLRYSFFPGGVNRDDLFQISPFGNQFYSTHNVPGTAVKALYSRLNAAWLALPAATRDAKTPAFSASQDPLSQPVFDEARTYEVIYHAFDKDRHVLPALAAILGQKVGASIFQGGGGGLTTSSVWMKYVCGAPAFACEPPLRRDRVLCQTVVPATSAGSAPRQCSDTLAVDLACPEHGAGRLVPTACPPACAVVYTKWWGRCSNDNAVHYLDTTHSLQLSAFYALCSIPKGGKGKGGAPSSH